MFAWTVWCNCIILYVSLQRGQTEGIWGNDLLDDYDDDLDRQGTDIWTEKYWTRSGTEVPTDSNRPPSGTGIYTTNNSTSSGTFVWTDDNSSGSGMDVPTDNKVTRQETDVPTENNVTRVETAITSDQRTESSRTTASMDEHFTGINTTRFPATAQPDICKNSSCPNPLILTTTVPGGENVTLRCGSVYDTSALWWYRDATVLHRGVGEVLLYIVDSDQSHSGLYLCIDESGCCIVEHHVSVYAVPPYAYHLAVMGAVLAVGIPFCVFLSVRQSSRFGRYARMFNTRHGEEKHLIL